MASLKTLFLRRNLEYSSGGACLCSLGTFRIVKKACLGLGRSADLSEGVGETWPLCRHGPRVWWVAFREGERQVHCSFLKKESVGGGILVSQSLNCCCLYNW